MNFAKKSYSQYFRCFRHVGNQHCVCGHPYGRFCYPFAWTLDVRRSGSHLVAEADPYEKSEKGKQKCLNNPSDASEITSKSLSLPLANFLDGDQSLAILDCGAAVPKLRFVGSYLVLGVSGICRL
jgi:hypothetical protein